MAGGELYIGEKNDKFNLTSSEYLHVNSCGIQYTMGKPYRVIRKNGRVDFHILYIKDGTCHAYYGGEYYKLNAGNFILYEPGHMHDYQYLKDCDTTSYWIHFCGLGASSAVSDCKILPGPHFESKNGSAENFFRLLAKSFYPGGANLQTRLNGLLLMLLSELGQRKEKSAASDRVSETLSFIHLNYHRMVRVDELAKLCNLSRSRFLHVFKEHVGASPIQYQNHFKIEKAKELLAVSSLSVSQVAAMVGFEDTFYFSRMFKRLVGVSPTEFRRVNGER